MAKNDGQGPATPPPGLAMLIGQLGKMNQNPSPMMGGMGGFGGINFGGLQQPGDVGGGMGGMQPSTLPRRDQLPFQGPPPMGMGQQNPMAPSIQPPQMPQVRKSMMNPTTGNIQPPGFGQSRSRR